MLRYLVQSTLFISKPKGLSEMLRNIHTSTNQIYKSEEKVNRTTKFSKRICLTPEVRENIAEKRISPLFHNILLLVVRFPY